MDATSKRIGFPDTPAGSIEDLISLLRLDVDGEYSSETAYLNILLLSASDYAERYLGRTLITSQWIRQYTKRQRVESLAKEYSGVKKFYLPFPPVQKIDEIKTISYDTKASEEETILTTDDYSLDLVSEPAEITLQVPLYQLERLYVKYTAGYGDSAEDIPPLIRQGILQHSAYMYAHRGDCDTDNSASMSGAIGLYQSYKVMAI
jgi:uncharacterized phiE125 gp8 family phage protein